MEHASVDRTSEQVDVRFLESPADAHRRRKDAEDALSHADQGEAAYLLPLREQQVTHHRQL